MLLNVNVGVIYSELQEINYGVLVEDTVPSNPPMAFGNPPCETHGASHAQYISRIC
jgi:hypothetical protein